MSGPSHNQDLHLARSLSGRESGSGKLGLTSVLFRPITLISLVLIGLFAFGALIVLGGFADDFRKTSPGQATPRSVSAVGYEALTEYLERLNYDVQETRGKRDFYDRQERLVIYSPSRPTRRLNRTLEAESEEARLIILPKWSVNQMQPQRGEEGQAGWARKTRGNGTHYESLYQNIVDDLPVLSRLDAPAADTQVVFTTPLTRNLADKHQPDFKHLQYFDLKARWPEYLDVLREERRVEREEERRKRAEARGEKYEPKEDKTNKEDEDAKTAEKIDQETQSETETQSEAPKPLPNPDVILKIDGKPVLIRLEDTQSYILSEPDLVNTMAFKTQGGAQLATAILNEIIRREGLDTLSVDFDVSLHGIEANRNIIKLMVTPPFLAATLCLLAAGGLVAWQGFNRFGDPARTRPDYAQGPVSLARTAAEFMGVSNRAHKTGEAYANLIRRQVATQLGYKDRTADHIDNLLDRREKRLKIHPPFIDLKNAIAQADPQSYSQYARALTTWREAMVDTRSQNDAQADS